MKIAGTIAILFASLGFLVELAQGQLLIFPPAVLGMLGVIAFALARFSDTQSKLTQMVEENLRQVRELRFEMERLELEKTSSVLKSRTEKLTDDQITKFLE